MNYSETNLTATAMNGTEHGNSTEYDFFFSTKTVTPTMSPTAELIDSEEVHEEDAYAAVFMNVALIGCVLLAYVIKKYRIYYVPESAASMIVGVIIGGIARWFIKDLTMYQFSPEFFFFVLLPPIIFEAGYGLQRDTFFDNIGAIVLYAMFGTIISTVIVGYSTFYIAKAGLISSVSDTNPMEALLFGALISAVDPVATLSIMGSPELHCNERVYSLVFGESVLNDAVAVVLFKTFHKYYDPEAPDLTTTEIPTIFLDFFSITIFSVLLGVGMGLFTSYIYKNTSISEIPKLESTLLFLFCYCCYATAEAFEMSGIMALFFNGIVLGHYNSYNLSEESRHSAEQIFATLATVAETIVFMYMGMTVFTSKFEHWDIKFLLYAMLFCVIGRICNIMPLSFISNLCRKTSQRITFPMQAVLCFAGLRGAIAFALATNMPGPNSETYSTVTLAICTITTVVCGGFTERVLSICGMRKNQESRDTIDTQNSLKELDEGEENGFFMNTQIVPTVVYDGVKGLMLNLDHVYLRPLFGGAPMNATSHRSKKGHDGLGQYELSVMKGSDDFE
mmetsp:Transcript_30409/g.35414  ORF Transcript_30409/g.35414 Transcript_30409/m.35414 type:complete len:563 (-) Transcript_30409:148-1836(-)